MPYFRQPWGVLRYTQTLLSGIQSSPKTREALTGNVDAMLRLASLHEHLGEKKQAQHWIRQAGEAGSIQAKYSMAYLQDGPNL